jgi:phosphoribosylaminoimidazolecarboxamide formyltransferase/IMP cyclohydrolase
MDTQIKIKTALISVYSKEHLKEIVEILSRLRIGILSTGGTYDYLKANGFDAVPVEAITSYPSILGGRVKTLHPKVFGGILWRRGELSDTEDVAKYEIPSVDLVIVDLYPFEKTVQATDSEEEIIEKIDIGGISLIRAAAKNYRHVLVIPDASYYGYLKELLLKKNGYSDLEDRRFCAAGAFSVSSHYDSEIFEFFNRKEKIPAFRLHMSTKKLLRYGENPHQEGAFYGDLEQIIRQLSGKELSYNNLVDTEAAIQLIREFEEPTVAIIKHTNPCGLASRDDLTDAWKTALACDPVSAFGGIIAVNRKLDMKTAEEINTLFFEIILAPEYEKEAVELLSAKKNRIILQVQPVGLSGRQFRSMMNGVLEQERDLNRETESDFQFVTEARPTAGETEDLLFANIVVKHLKSNAIALVKGKQMIGCGMGQPSRVDSVKQAILKANTFGFDTTGAVLASDAFFPFADSIELAWNAGVRAVIQPGGSVRDKDSVNFCNEHGVSMVFTGIRHFKH